jgi:hypothetical protein
MLASVPTARKNYTTFSFFFHPSHSASRSSFLLSWIALAGSWRGLYFWPTPPDPRLLIPKEVAAPRWYSRFRPEIVLGCITTEPNRNSFVLMRESSLICFFSSPCSLWCPNQRASPPSATSVSLFLKHPRLFLCSQASKSRFCSPE